MKIKVKVLSPLHISADEPLEKDFNFFEKDGDVYFLDEFRVVDYFLSRGFGINWIYLNRGGKRVLSENAKKEIIKNRLYTKKVKNSLELTKNEVIPFISPKRTFIPGSSIKGAIKTAIVNCLLNANNQNPVDCMYEVKDMKERCESLINSSKNKSYSKNRLKDNRGEEKTLDDDLVEFFSNLIVRDVEWDFKTQIYKSINIKICKDYQTYRKNKVERIANFVEGIVPGSEFEMEIIDKKGYFKNLGRICNSFYLSKLKEDINYAPLCYSEKGKEYPECENDYKELEDCLLERVYFYKGGMINKLSLSNKIFLLNIGRFGGARKKSFDNFRNIKNSHCDDKKYTTTKTYALDKKGHSPYFEKELLPFGWVLCEILE